MLGQRERFTGRPADLARQSHSPLAVAEGRGEVLGVGRRQAKLVAPPRLASSARQVTRPSRSSSSSISAAARS